MHRSIVFALAIAFLVAGVGAAANQPTGNGAPSGSHFTLNVLGKESVGAGTGGTGGSKLFVPLWGKCRVGLTQGDFKVLDADCVSDKAASFQLPAPDPDGDGISAYAVFVRPLGKPGGSGSFTTCLTDADGVEWCSTESVVTTRLKGKSSFTDVSREMLTVCYDADADGVLTREPLFANSTHGYFWEYSGAGLRHAQLRFYPVAASIGGLC